MTLGDREHPISVRFDVHVQGPHVRVEVWAGHKEGGRGKAGTLTMRREEWALLADALDPAHATAAPAAVVDGVAVHGALPFVEFTSEPPESIEDALFGAGLRGVSR